MEKIKLALEKAKRQRSGNKTDSVVQTPDVEKSVPQGNEEIKVSYEQTRVVKLSPEHLAKNRIVSFNKSGQLSLGFDILRTQVLKKMQENGWRTLGITSPTPACGKTVVSINLAMSIAHHTDKTAILVDFDLRRPSVAKYLGLPDGPSLNDVLADEATVSEALVNPGLDRLVVLPTAAPVSHSSEILSSAKVTNLIQEFRDRYEERIVVFDLTPLLGSDNTMIMLPQVDCVLAVVGNGMVSHSELTESMRYIDPDKLVGTVLNKSDNMQTASSYYYY